ncbi:MAG: acyltransferase [Lachnospiraceae bacterium]|nr:acyltransferase [Lachnospiraceae bacterium]
MRRERIVYCDILRIIAIVGVIGIHSGMGRYFSWAVELFVMISGAVWLSREEEIDLKTLYSRNILRIGMAFCFWSVFYTILYGVFLPLMRNEALSVKEILVMLAQGRYHLWFCYLIVGIYMGMPFFSKIAENRILLKYFLGVSYFFSIAVPGLQNIPKLEWTSWMTDIINWNWARYAFYFTAGYYFHTVQWQKMWGYAICAFGMLSYVIMCLQAGGMFHGVFLCGAVVMIFLLCRKLLEYHDIGEKNARIIAKGAEMCFGVYLIHDFYLTIWDFVTRYVCGVEIREGVGRVIVTAAASFGSVWLMRRCSFLKKFV